MSFVYSAYIIPVIILISVFVYTIISYEKSFYGWIKKYWFFQRSNFSKLSSVLYLVGFSLLLIATLDLRGKEEQINAKISDQKTIVIIDSSASMLVQDVRPNRFLKSLLMARHFIKKSVGHQIAVVLFSDTQKRLIPFTDDFDLLDARIAGLEGMNISNGGSNIIQAIMESVQYFKTDLSKNEKIMGNILVFTDSEDNGQISQLDIPDGINLGVVAVGTTKGGRIPVRTPQGRVVGYKKFNGQEIISKLDENFLKKLGEEVDSYKYWVALSYSIPTEEILSFFRTKFQTKLSQGNIRIRPVKGYHLISLGIVLLTLSFLLRLKKSFIVPLLIIFTLFNIENSYAQMDEGEGKPPVDPKILAQISELLAKDQNGDLEKNGRLKLAELFALSGEDDKALTIYEENVSSFDENTDTVIFNYGTTLLKKDKIDEAILMLQYLKERIKNDENKEELKNLVNKNILKALEKQKQDKKKKKEEEEQQKNKKEGGDSGDGKQGKGDQQKEEKDKKENKDKKEDQKGDGDKKKNEEPSKPQTLSEKEEEIKKKRKMVKIPAVIKQILNDDRGLQKKYQDTSTQQNQRDKKDW